MKIQINIHVYHDFTISQTMNHSLLQCYKITAAACGVSSTILRENYLCGLRNSMASFFLWSFFFLNLPLRLKNKFHLPVWPFCPLYYVSPLALGMQSVQSIILCFPSAHHAGGRWVSRKRGHAATTCMDGDRAFGVCSAPAEGGAVPDLESRFNENC